ncbi:hypothetical protein DMUE_2376 [Dictyocoela muelleri]|nr:hypothetical protein DMUE_2376 [Dictyocoela muelleri]
MRWKDDVVIHVLEELKNEKYHHIITTKRAIETNIQSLINAKYRKNYAFIYLKNIERIKQENFILMKDYYVSIAEETRKFARCNNFNEHEIMNRIEEHFMKNLHPEITMYFTEMCLFSSEDILKKSEIVEMKLIEQSSNQVFNLNKNTTSDSKFENSTKLERKYCKVYKTSNHSNSECFTQKKNLRIKDEFNKRNYLYIKLYFQNFF